MVTNELLDEKIKILERQRDEHFAVYQQAIGAIGILQHLKTETKDHLTTEELGRMVGGEVEAIEPV